MNWATRQFTTRRRSWLWGAAGVGMLAGMWLWSAIFDGQPRGLGVQSLDGPATITNGAEARTISQSGVEQELGMGGARTAVDSAEEGALQVLLEQFDACERAGMSIWLIVDGQVLERLAPEGNQRPTLAGSISSGWVVAWSPAGGLRLAQSDSLVGEVDLLPTGNSAVDGRMESFAGADLMTVDLELVSDDSPLTEANAGLEGVLSPTLGDLRVRKACVELGGHFRVMNLPDAWSGVLRLDERHCFLPEQDQGPWIHDERGRPFALSLSRPIRGLQLRVERTPFIAGRLVWSDDSTPVAGAVVRLTATCIAKSGCPTVTLISDSNGNFEVVLSPRIGLAPEDWWGGEWRSSLDKLMIEVEAPGGALLHFTRDFRGILPEGELGTLEVPRGERLTLRVVDWNGAPVRDVVGVLDRRAIRADDQGLMTVTGCLPGRRVSICARGYDVGVVEIDEQVLQSVMPHEVVLQAGTDLTIEVQDSLGRNPEGLRLSAICDWSFVGRPLDWSAVLLHNELSACKCRGAGDDGEGLVKLELRSNRDGRFVLLGTRPRSLIQVVIRDPSGNPMLEETVAAPPTGLATVARLSLPFSVGSVSGRVEDPAGIALDEASVRLVGVDGTRFARSDAHGHYSLPSVRLPASDLELLVERSGFSPSRASFSDLSLDQELPTVVLQPARRLRVLVLDANKEAVVGAHLAVQTADGAEAVGTELSGGYYAVENAAEGPCIVVVQRGAYSYRRPVTANGSDIEIEVPSLAKLEVLLTRKKPSGTPSSWMTLEVLSSEGEHVAQGPFEKRDGAMLCSTLLEPGRYRVRAELSSMTPEGIQRTPLTDEVEVVVASLGTTRITVD